MPDKHDPESVALNALFEKYKPSRRDFVLARMAARIETVEIMLVELCSQKGSEERRRLSERNLSDTLALTENYLELLSRDGSFRPGKASPEN
jgi:hypothetical protein